MHADTGADTVPAPVAPDDREAWYAPRVVDQREIHPGVVVTVRRDVDGTGFVYEVREPPLGPGDERTLGRARAHFADATLSRPRTREETRERLAAGFEGKYARAFARLVETTPTARRRISYHALAALRGLGPLTPHALDDRIEMVDPGDPGDPLVLHLADYAPVRTDLVDPPGVERFASERVERYTVAIHGYEVPVVRYHRHLLGGDPFESHYAVQEPDLLPGDAELLAECKERVWETRVGRVVDDGAVRAAFVRDRAESLLDRRLTARNARTWLASLRLRAGDALATYGVGVPPVDDRYARDRLDDLVYYAVRDLVGYGQLTVPILDDRLEDIEANRVGERVKVVPRDGGGRRVPTNLAFETESGFVNVVTKLAAEDGVELSASTPSAKVNLDPAGVDATIRCAVSLPVVSEDGPHVSIRKQAADPLTPVDLLERGAISRDLVALLWLFYEHGGVVLFAGPTGVGKTTLLNAHVPFIPYDARPISIDEGSREVFVPHETGISLTTRDHEEAFKRVTMSDLMTEANYLNPDVEIIAEVNSRPSFETFAETLQTGHGVLGTTHAEDVETLVNRVTEQGLPAYLLREIDLVVFPRQVGGRRYVGEAIEFLPRSATRTLAHDDWDALEKDGTRVHYNRVARRTHDGDWSFAPRGGDARHVHAFAALAARTDRPVAAVEREFDRKRGYVDHLVRADVRTMEELFGFLADLRNDEAATVERIGRLRSEATPRRGGPRDQGSDSPGTGGSRPSVGHEAGSGAGDAD